MLKVSFTQWYLGHPHCHHWLSRVHRAHLIVVISAKCEQIAVFWNLIYIQQFFMATTIGFLSDWRYFSSPEMFVLIVYCKWVLGKYVLWLKQHDMFTYNYCTLINYNINKKKIHLCSGNPFTHYKWGNFSCLTCSLWASKRRFELLQNKLKNMTAREGGISERHLFFALALLLHYLFKTYLNINYVYEGCLVHKYLL